MHYKAVNVLQFVLVALLIHYISGARWLSGLEHRSQSIGPRFESHQCRFESWASLFTPRCLNLSGCFKYIRNLWQ